METVAVVGVGLIGGSFALALRKAGFSGRMLGVSSPEAASAAIKRNIIDEALPLEEAARRADLIYLSKPIRGIIAAIGALGPYLRPGALVTDAGSTKSAIVKAGDALPEGAFLGGHPMAGKEKSGVEQAEADLFAGRTYVLTPREPAMLETGRGAELMDWVRRIGAIPAVMDPEEHDRVVAWTSHLPQLASTALAVTVGERIATGEGIKAAGPGLRDATRLALSPYAIWADILETNRPAIETALDAFIARLQAMRADLCSERTAKDFSDAAMHAPRLRREGTE